MQATSLILRHKMDKKERFPSKGINRQCELKQAREIYAREACIRERLYY